MNAVMKKMNSNADIKKYLNLFLFKTLDSMQDDFANNWKKFDGSSCGFI